MIFRPRINPIAALWDKYWDMTHAERHVADLMLLAIIAYRKLNSQKRLAR